MLRAIFSAIRSALSAMRRAFGYVVLAPCAALSRIFFGFHLEAPIDIPEVAPPEDLAPNKPVENFFCKDLAAVVMGWCADSLLRDAPASVPSTLPLAIKEWLPGLTRAECDAIIEAEKTAVSAHLQRFFTLPGVRPVQRLGRLETWPPEWKEMTSETGHFMVAAVDYALARSAAGK